MQIINELSDGINVMNFQMYTQWCFINKDKIIE